MPPYYADSSLHQYSPRDAREVLTPNDTQKVTLIVAACYIVVIAILVCIRSGKSCLVLQDAVADGDCRHVPILEKVIYPFKLLTVGMHEMSHALAGVLTCATVEKITLDPNEGGSTRMRGGIPAITLPAGYLGSSFIGASLVACGFDTNASKVACLILAFFWILTLWWAKKSWVAWATIALMAGLIVICWLVAKSVALRFFILFIGTMSCFYAIWDIVDDTLSRKINTSDASEYATMIGCGGSRFWGAFWLLVACVFFACGVLVGIAAFKDDWDTQARQAENFLGGTP
ncbi:uncharacterized protein L203_100975 [Cryptococcus depauperatus CBS 7841]|uniref:Peptidase M50B-like-domain-containing protein n=1 Tax=Cryptococcus depauperatus CBS 7841 TaxID=1295531 RepID=A0AAJ8JP26_9TREE